MFRVGVCFRLGLANGRERGIAFDLSQAGGTIKKGTLNLDRELLLFVTPEGEAIVPERYRVSELQRYRAF